jgi:uncharacterized caspase-like protein
MKMLKLLILCATLLALVVAARAETKVALVVGNGAYAHAPALKNPVNDATDMAAALRDLGFRVIEAHDADKAALEAQLRQFVEAADGSDVALLFYAGHGVQVDGRNYLIPVDARLERRSAIDFEVVDLERVTAALQNAAKASLVFLDACRDNPFANNLAAQNGRAFASPRGLAPLAAGSAAGLLIALSTAPGKIAADGEGRNSPFTAALLRNVGTPGADVTTVLTRVRNEVASATNDEQIPWVTMSLSSPIYLAPGASTAPASPPAPPAPSLCQRLVDTSASVQAVMATDVEAGLRACAEDANLHPNDAGLIDRLKAAKEQRTFKNSMSASLPDALETYLLLYPAGRYVDAVRARLSALAPPPAVASTPPPEPAPAPRDLASGTRTIVEQYWAITNDLSQDGSAFQPLYADSVAFYGDLKSRSDILRLKLAYFKDWGLRQYSASEVRVRCEQTLCTEEGVVEWRVTSETRRVMSTGRSTFAFVVDWSSGRGKIISETGAVLNREAHKL